MAKPLRLGYKMTLEESKAFAEIDRGYVVTQRQKDLVRNAKKSCSTHPIKF